MVVVAVVAVNAFCLPLCLEPVNAGVCCAFLEGPFVGVVDAVAARPVVMRPVADAVWGIEAEVWRAGVNMDAGGMEALVGRVGREVRRGLL